MIGPVAVQYAHYVGRNTALEQFMWVFGVFCYACAEEDGCLDQHQDRVHEAYDCAGTVGRKDGYAGFS